MNDVNHMETLSALKPLIMKPVYFNNLCVMLVDVLSARHDPDWTVDRHHHPWFEFNYVAEGAVYTTIEEAEFLIQAGQSYLIPPGAAHSHRNADRRGDIGFCLRWQFSVMADREQVADNLIGQILIDVFKKPRAYALRHEWNRLLLEIDQSKSLFSIQSAFIHWLTYLFDQWHDSAKGVVSPNQQIDTLVQQVLFYLEAYSATRFLVQDLANALHVSYRHLSRSFKQKTGITIIEKLNDIRIGQAKKLLIETNLTLREIACETGFDNEYYLSNTFHRYAFITATEFRRLAREG